jgi:hypothetical protein
MKSMGYSEISNAFNMQFNMFENTSQVSVTSPSVNYAGFGYKSIGESERLDS